MSIQAIGALVGVVGNVIDDLVTTEEEKLKAELDYYRIDAELAKGQLEINAAEAKHKSMFVAGWRPFIGWVCGSAFAYSFVAQPFLIFILAIVGKELVLPELDLSQMMPVLLGMLGLGGLRTYEKQMGVASESLSPTKKKRKGFLGLGKRK
jgi:hypothetical protein